MRKAATGRVEDVFDLTKHLMPLHYRGVDPDFPDTLILHPTRHEMGLVGRAVRAAGLENQGQTAAVVNPDAGHFNARFLRGLVWTHYPVVSDAHFKLNHVIDYKIPVYKWGEARSASGAVSMIYCPTTPVHIEDLRRSVSRVIIIPNQERDSFSAPHMSAFVRAYLRDRDREYWIFGQDGSLHRATVDDVFALERPWRAGWRLEWSYAVNFHAIASKALHWSIETVDVGNLSERNLDRIRQKEFGFPDFVHKDVERAIRAVANDFRFGRYDRLAHPRSLQFLHAIRKLGKSSVVPDHAAPVLGDVLAGLFDSPPPVAWAVLPDDGLPLVPHWRRTNSSKIRQWAGTGKHAPSPIDLCSLTGDVEQFLCLGLVEIDAELRVSLSPRGHAFLDALHPSNEDPDCLCRWRDPETGLIPESEIPSIDDWLTRFFRKMKTRVNRL